MAKLITKNIGFYVVLTALVSAGYFMFCFWWPLQPFGSAMTLPLVTVGILLMLVALLLIPVALLMACWSRFRGRALQMVLLLVVGLLCAVLGNRLGGEIRRQAFLELGQRSERLVRAIHRYEEDHQQPPARLALLTPRYVREIPGTGMGAYPDYQLRLADDPETLHGNHWMLLVEASLGILNWDQMIYYPNQQYPERAFGGYLEVLGEWAYVHE